jgi:hypothetical protein
MKNAKTQTVVVETPMFTQFAHDLMQLGDKASQLALEPVLKGHSLADVLAVGSAGNKLAGSAERATAAMINVIMRDHTAPNEDGILFHWSQVERGDKSPLAKALQPIKDQCFKEWANHSNKYVVWARVRVYGYELDHPKIAEPIGEGEEGAEGEGAGGTPSRTRDHYSRFVVELGKLYRTGINPENDAKIRNHPRGVEVISALEHVTHALKALNAPLDDEELKNFMYSMK